MARIIQVKGQVEWKYAYTRGKKYVGICHPLRVTVQGDTFADMMDAAQEGMQGMLEDLLKENALDRFLHSLGWTRSAMPRAARGPIQFDIPLNTTQVPAHDLKAVLCG